VLASATGLGIPHRAAFAVTKVQVSIPGELRKTAAVRQREGLASERNDRFLLSTIFVARALCDEPLHQGDQPLLKLSAQDRLHP
jgi:hypothetical protein